MSSVKTEISVPETNQDNHSIHAWRIQTLNVIYVNLLIFGALALISSSIEILVEQRASETINPLTRIGLYLLAYTLVGILYFIRSIPYTLRAGIPIVLLYSIGILDFYLFGMDGQGALFFFASITLTTTLFGLRYAIGAMIVSTVIMIVIATAQITNALTFPFEINPTAYMDDMWFDEILLVVFLMVIVIVPTGAMIRRLGDSLEKIFNNARYEREASSIFEQQSYELAEKTKRLEQVETNLRILVDELETPSVMLADGIMLAPIVGYIDEQRLARMTQRILNDIQKYRIRQMILDITGVATMDTAVANSLIRLTQAVRLLGCEISMTGISSTVAAIIVQQRIDLRSIRIARSPQDVLNSYESITRNENNLS
jgi:rsbT co-antagonist protein RsbR